MMKIGRCASVLLDAEKRIGTVQYRILFPSKPVVKGTYSNHKVAFNKSSIKNIKSMKIQIFYPLNPGNVACFLY